jgi:hypothetical protein
MLKAAGCDGYFVCSMLSAWLNETLILTLSSVDTKVLRRRGTSAR